MGIHYVFMLILEIFNLSEKCYISGRVTMSKLQIRGCLSVRVSVARYNELQLKKLQGNFRDLYIFELSRMWRNKL